ncbi:MAG: efflux RND transporter periplasmic adaptor subunit [Rhodospirillaceae bacterium]|nr:efflux RND transporter periplasmic adaptor subunit [Rhodospirillaceae bacterium]
MTHIFAASAALTGVLLTALTCPLLPAMAAGEHSAPAAEEFERGPHNGRLLRDGDVAVEMTIFEDGVPPEYRVYAYRGNAPLPPSSVDLTVELGRLGGITDRFSFTPQGDYLRGSGPVVEPHSFDVRVRATIGGKTHDWAYESYEGRVQISDQVAEANGVKTAVAGPVEIKDTVVASGRIVRDPARMARLNARFPGVIRELRKSLGDAVAKGETIAVIESNDSLQTYAIKSPLDGLVVAQYANSGETVAEAPIVEVADLRQVFAELYVFPRDIARIAAGQTVRINAADGDNTADSTVTMTLPVTGPASQALPVRVRLDNADLRWPVGAAVEGTITVGAKQVPLAVRMSGLQSFRDFTVVFAKFDDTYEVRMLDLGIDDGEHVEVLGGLDPGTTYVSENSFLIKADIEKSGASHDH